MNFEQQFIQQFDNSEVILENSAVYFRLLEMFRRADELHEYDKENIVYLENKIKDKNIQIETLIEMYSQLLENKIKDKNIQIETLIEMYSQLKGTIA